jgi:hypothetical protein
MKFQLKKISIFILSTQQYLSELKWLTKITTVMLASVLKLSRRQNSVKSSPAGSRVKV